MDSDNLTIIWQRRTIRNQAVNQHGPNREYDSVHVCVREVVHQYMGCVEDLP